jgi:hypothetical protein
VAVAETGFAALADKAKVKAADDITKSRKKFFDSLLNNWPELAATMLQSSRGPAPIKPKLRKVVDALNNVPLCVALGSLASGHQVKIQGPGLL